jgi:hypothetical protein
MTEQTLFVNVKTSKELTAHLVVAIVGREIGWLLPTKANIMSI